MGWAKFWIQILTSIEVEKTPTSKQMRQAKSLIEYTPDANVLAQAISAKPDWLISHDKEHFIGNDALSGLPFKIGTPGDVLAWIRENLQNDEDSQA